MTAAASMDLRALREHPFDLLREIERRTRVALTGDGADTAQGEEWVGIGFRLGNERFVVARDEVREVLMVPAALTRVPGARAWVRGLANVRGHLLPVIDLRAFLGAGAASQQRSTRVMVVNSSEFPAGLLVDEVYGFRRFQQREFAGECPPTLLRCDSYLGGAWRRGLELWPAFSFVRLIESRHFQRAAED